MLHWLKNIGGITFTVVILMILIAAFDWVLICGIFKLICLCFGWQFSWAIATGIWLILTLLSMTKG